MKIQISTDHWKTLDSDLAVFPLFEDELQQEEPARSLNQYLDGLLTELIESREWQGKRLERTVLYRPGTPPVRRLILVGAGPRKNFGSGLLRELVHHALRQVSGPGLKRAAVVLPLPDDVELCCQAAVEGAILSTYDPGEYKTEDRRTGAIEEVTVVVPGGTRHLLSENLLERAHIQAQATNLARALVNEPGNFINPSRLAEKAREIAERTELHVEIYDENEMERRGMNAILAVARGSDEPARLITLKHLGTADPSAPPLVLVGKGVTFDSGGLSLKPSAGMEEMKADKAGACAVLAAMQAIARLQIPRNVVGVIPTVENLPSGRAQRPGDVIRSMSGKTIEVLNTDAEGRLILADALTFARQELQAAALIDLATLTGSCVVALGHLRAGLFSNDELLCEQILKAADRSGEKLWRLPLDEEYRRELDSNIADIKNVGSRWGGAITAAKFLQEFAGETPWCHIDMAGVDLYEEKHEFKGPTGFGVTTLVELARSLED